MTLVTGQMMLINPTGLYKNVPCMRRVKCFDMEVERQAAIFESKK